VAGCPWSSHPAPLAAASWPRALAASRLLLSAVAWHQAREAPLKVRQAPREAAWAWLGVFLMFLVFCLPTMNGIVLAYFTKELQRDVGLTIAQYGCSLVRGRRPARTADALMRSAGLSVACPAVQPSSASLHCLDSLKRGHSHPGAPALSAVSVMSLTAF